MVVGVWEGGQGSLGRGLREPGKGAEGSLWEGLPELSSCVGECVVCMCVLALVCV